MSGKLIKTLILTASHVSQGSGLIINGDSPHLPLLGRLADNRHDLEVLETSTGALSSKAQWLSLDRRIIIDAETVKRWRASGMILNQEEPALGDQGAFVLTPPWSSPGSIQASDSENQVSIVFGHDPDAFERLVHLPITNEYFGRGKISPGMSGSPLVQKSLDHDGRGVWVLRGVASRLSRDFTGSWFVSDKTVADLVESYLSGKRGRVDSTQWKLWKDVTYRDYGDGTLETVPLRDNAGSQGRGDGGNQGRGDGGNQGRGDGGNQGRGDGGNQGRGDGGDKSSPIRETLDPGMIYRNQPVIGLEIRYGLAVYADPEALDLIELLHIASNEIKPISKSTDFSELLVKKLLSSAAFTSPDQSDALKAIAEHRPFSVESMMLNDALDLELASKSMPQMSLEKDGSMRFRFNGPMPAKERIDFTLTAHGSLASPSGAQSTSTAFQPIIEVKGSLGGVYLIDLRRLFFVDLSRIGKSANFPWFSVSSQAQNSAVDLELDRASHEGPVLTFKQKNSTRSFEIIFATPGSQIRF
jgi:hypothetical protein